MHTLIGSKSTNRTGRCYSNRKRQLVFHVSLSVFYVFVKTLTIQKFTADMRKLIFIFPVLFWFSGLIAQPQSVQSAVTDKVQNLQKYKEMSFYDLPVTLINGEEFSLSELKGKYVIVLNVASECGYTPQYAAWEQFYQENKEQNVVVIGVPCNQFGEQEPGTGEEIVQFCQKNYGVSFPMLEKCDVLGENQSPLYVWLTSQETESGLAPEPSWNFCKYLINPEGKLLAFFKSGVTPASSEFIETLAR